MDHEISNDQQRQLQNQQQFYDGLAVVDFLMSQNGDDLHAVLEIAKAEDARCARLILNDGGFWREVIKIVETSLAS